MVDVINHHFSRVKRHSEEYSPTLAPVTGKKLRISDGQWNFNEQANLNQEFSELHENDQNIYPLKRSRYTNEPSSQSFAPAQPSLEYLHFQNINHDLNQTNLRLQNELMQIKSQLNDAEFKYNHICEENKLLKRAVGILDAKSKDESAKNLELTALLQRSCQMIQELERTNGTLREAIMRSYRDGRGNGGGGGGSSGYGGGGLFMPPPPPDVF